MMANSDSVKPYLDYLDKEMTIQGLLSAFCVAASAAAFDRILGAEHPSPLVSYFQRSCQPYILTAILALMLAGLLFYLQRSELAWLHGQISLDATRRMEGIDPPDDSYTLAECIFVADSWTLWNRYKWGLTLATVGATEVGLALASMYIPFFVYHRRIADPLPLVLGCVFAGWLSVSMREKDSQLALATKKPRGYLRRARAFHKSAPKPAAIPPAKAGTKPTGHRDEQDQADVQ
jgi:hypothetical protein